MRHFILALMASLGLATTAQAVEVDAPLTLEPSGPGGVFYSIDLAALGLSQIAWIEIEDPGTNSSGRQNSGFDLDALFLDMDGDFSTATDRVFASSFDVMLGSASNGTSTATLNNTNPDGTVDFAAATLDVFDGVAATTSGFFSMGDNGIVRANFNPIVPITGTLFLFAGELGDREYLGRVTVSDTPAIPLPAGAILLLTGIGGLMLRRRT